MAEAALGPSDLGLKRHWTGVAWGSWPWANVALGQCGLGLKLPGAGCLPSSALAEKSKTKPKATQSNTLSIHFLAQTSAGPSTLGWARSPEPKRPWVELVLRRSGLGRSGLGRSGLGPKRPWAKAALGWRPGALGQCGLEPMWPRTEVAWGRGGLRLEWHCGIRPM